MTIDERKVAAEAYADSIDDTTNIRNLIINTYIQAHSDGENEKDAFYKSKLIEFFNSDKELNNTTQEELWKTFGLKLVCWDYENNKLDVVAENLSNLVKHSNLVNKRKMDKN